MRNLFKDLKWQPPKWSPPTVNKYEHRLTIQFPTVDHPIHARVSSEAKAMFVKKALDLLLLNKPEVIYEKKLIKQEDEGYLL